MVKWNAILERIAHQSVRNTVRAIRVTGTANVELAVPIWIKSTGPKPAGAEVGATLWNGTIAVDLGPEAVSEIRRASILVRHRSTPK